MQNAVAPPQQSPSAIELIAVDAFTNEGANKRGRRKRHVHRTCFIVRELYCNRRIFSLRSRSIAGKKDNSAFCIRESSEVDAVGSNGFVYGWCTGDFALSLARDQVKNQIL
jgi:hypothetical protein